MIQYLLVIWFLGACIASVYVAVTYTNAYVWSALSSYFILSVAIGICVPVVLFAAYYLIMYIEKLFSVKTLKEEMDSLNYTIEKQKKHLAALNKQIENADLKTKSNQKISKARALLDEL